MNKKIKILFAFFLVVAILDTIYLTWEHFSNVVPPCHTGFSFVDCGVVLRSKYAVILGIPTAMWGLFYYLGVAGIFGLMIFTKKKIWEKLILYVTPIGLIVSLGFLAIQLGILHAICFYCTLSGICSLMLFILTVMNYEKLRGGSSS